MCRTALGIPYRVFSSLPKNPSPAGFLPPGRSFFTQDRSFVGKRKMGRRAHWIDPQTNRRLDYTKIIPEANIELSGIWQMEFYTENPATHFQNGILSDLEVLAIKRFKGGFGIGFVESWIQQVTDDGGAAADALN